MSENNDIFITNIHINKVVNIENFTIALNEKERQHLIITGKNGSGKTTLLTELDKFLAKVYNSQHIHFDLHKKNHTQLTKVLSDNPQGTSNQSGAQLRNGIAQATQIIESFGQTEIEFSAPDDIVDKASLGKFLFVYLEAKRETKLQNTDGPKTITFKDKYPSKESLRESFLQYLVNLRVGRSLARDDGDETEAQKIDAWFTRLESWLAKVFEAESVNLVMDRTTFSYSIQIDGQTPFPLVNGLADGHSAILSIIMELMLRMDNIHRGSYDMQGIVLIDEIETHLHVNLQKEILPWLIDFFPNVQFIVSTHSPFVLSSIENAVICDLESKIVTEDLSTYSYETLIESYFDSNKYSHILQQKMARYEELVNQSIINDEFFDLEHYLDDAPQYGSIEFKLKYQELKRKARLNGNG